MATWKTEANQDIWVWPQPRPQPLGTFDRPDDEQAPRTPCRDHRQGTLEIAELEARNWQDLRPRSNRHQGRLLRARQPVGDGWRLTIYDAADPEGSETLCRHAQNPRTTSGTRSSRRGPATEPNPPRPATWAPAQEPLSAVRPDAVRCEMRTSADSPPDRSARLGTSGGMETCPIACPTGGARGSGGTVDAIRQSAALANLDGRLARGQRFRCGPLLPIGIGRSRAAQRQYRLKVPESGGSTRAE